MIADSERPSRWLEHNHHLAGLAGFSQDWFRGQPLGIPRPPPHPPPTLFVGSFAQQAVIKGSHSRLRVGVARRDASFVRVSGECRRSRVLARQFCVIE